MSDQQEFLDLLSTWAEASIHFSMRAFIHHNRDQGFSVSQANTLFRLYHHGAQAVNDLATHLGVTKAAVSQMLDRLVDDGLILRQEDPSDRRSKQIVLTEKGCDAVHQGMQARQAWVDELAGQFDTATRARLAPALATLVEGVHHWQENKQKNTTGEQCKN